MILILSKNNEPTTNEVIKWIHYINPKIDITRLNTDTIKDICVSEEDLIITTTTNVKVDLKNITSVWYRKGGITRTIEFEKLLTINDYNFKKALFDFLSIENYDLIKIIFKFLSKKKHINKASDSIISKIEMLQAAEKVGLKTPHYMITNKKEDIGNFLDIHKRIITKPIRTVFRSFGEKFSLQLYTTEITRNIYKNLPSSFFSSFFQQLIEKKYELRIVFLHGHFFSMAIFSQLDTQTSLDFRNYTLGKNGRWVPYRLNRLIELKLRKFMKLLNLNSGSIDIIVDKKDVLYFLEVNPIGQFGMTSKPCNYFIEREFAYFLTNHKV